MNVSMLVHVMPGQVDVTKFRARLLGCQWITAILLVSKINVTTRSGFVASGATTPDHWSMILNCSVIKVAHTI